MHTKTVHLFQACIWLLLNVLYKLVKKVITTVFIIFFIYFFVIQVMKNQSLKKQKFM